MPVLIGKANDLVLDRRTVARSGAVYLTRVERTAVNVFVYDIMRILIGVNDMAGKLLFTLEKVRRSAHRKGSYAVLTRLNFKTGEVDGAFLYSCGCTCFKAHKLYALTL